MRRTTSTLTAAAALITLTAGCSGDQSPGLQPADATGPLTIPAAVHATLSKPAPPSLAPSHLRYGPAAFTLWQPNPRAGPAPTNPVLQRRPPLRTRRPLGPLPRRPQADRPGLAGVP